MSFADLITPAQDAVFTALAPIATSAGITGLQVFQHVPENTQPPYIMIGQISSENETNIPGEQLELITVEVIHVWRGNRRRELLAMMAAARAALNNQPIGAAGAVFSLPDFLKAETGEAIADGVTYVGIQTFQFHAQPA